MNVIGLATSMMMLSSIFFQAHASADVEITWTNSEHYTDVKDAFDSIRSTKEDAFYNIENVLNKLAKKLPNGYLLKLNVTDVDLAGETHSRNIRVIRNTFGPKITFSYQLIDNNNKIMLENDEILRDSSFMSGQSLRYKNDAFGFEKQLLDDWFKDSFAEYFVRVN